MVWFGSGVRASLFIERIFDADANEVSPAPSDETLTQDGVRNGAQIGANSWGNDVQGEYDTDAAQFDELVRDADSVTPGDQPYILEFSAGNAGPDSQTLTARPRGKTSLPPGPRRMWRELRGDLWALCRWAGHHRGFLQLRTV